MRAVAVLLVLAVALPGCASSAPPRPAARPFDHVRQLAIVVSGESRFSVLEHRAEPGRTFDEVLKWGVLSPYQALLRPVAELVHKGVNWLLDADRKTDAAVDLGGIAPRSVVSAAFVQALEASARFDEIQIYAREPLGEDRRRAEAIVRISVPAWGLVRIREGEPDLVSAFADARAEMVAPAIGVVIWEATEDVTDPERLPMKSFTGDRDFTRQQLIDVLQRAGQRLASELLYARGAGR
ncbi:MAG: hypothetical protein DMD78_29150 [Candidatus Rokuibacteriota bacterium]|nr:MAG: hypothetical protein DMD78_29150 [Candidatus Rokubacteria bacterium]